MARPRGDRGERITGTAARLFRERGFHATTIDDLGRAEGISGGAIYRHFAGKDELLAAVAQRGVDHIGDCLAAVDDAAVAAPEERLALDGARRWSGGARRPRRDHGLPARRSAADA